MLQPRKGESKQDFLSRAVKSLMAGGMTEEEALGKAAAAWNTARMEAEFKDGVARLGSPDRLHLEEPGQGDGVQAAARRFSVLAYTGKVVTTWFGDFIIDLAGMRLAKDTVPALYHHDSWTIDAILGVIDKSDTTDAGFAVFGSFSARTEMSAKVQALADEGFPWQASIGVHCLRSEEIAAGVEVEVNGRTISGPMEIWRETQVFETSFLPFGADSDTAAVAMSADGKADKTNLSKEEEAMDPKLRALLERLGLSADATEDQAWAYLRNLDPNSVRLAGDGPGLTDDDKAVLAAAVAEIKSPQASTKAQPDAATLSADDVNQLYQNGAQLGLDAQAVGKIIKDGGAGATMASVTQAMFAEAANAQPKPFGAQARIDMGADERDKYRLAAVDGMCLRLGHRIEKAAPGATEFRGMGMVELARDVMERNGLKTRGLSRDAVARAILGGDRRFDASLAAMSTSDFSSIYLDVGNKSLLRAYMEAPATWKPWTNVVTATDFKTIYGISLSGAGDLELISENGEYKEDSFSDNQESYAVKSYGKLVTLTRKMLVNDDLRAFDRLPRLFGASAARKASDIVYALLTANGNLNDGTALFATTRGNLASGSGNVGTVTSDLLSDGRAAMRKFTGMADEKLDIRPRYLLVPVAQETDAEVLLRSMALPDDNKSSGVYNPWAGKLEPIAEPRLDDNSVTAWYLVGDPAQVDTIEVAFLDGNEAPQIREDNPLGRDGIRYEITFDIGAGAMDWRGFYKNPGA